MRICGDTRRMPRPDITACISNPSWGAHSIAWRFCDKLTAQIDSEAPSPESLLNNGIAPFETQFSAFAQKNSTQIRLCLPSENAAGTIRSRRLYRQRFEFRETPMKMAKIMLAGLAALSLVSAASAQQAMTGTVTRIDRLDG